MKSESQGGGIGSGCGNIASRTVAFPSLQILLFFLCLLQAQNVAKVLHDVRSGRPSREFVNQGIDDETEWFKKLGGRQPVAAEPAEETPIPQGVKRLMRVSDSSGELKMTEVRSETGNYKTEALAPDAAAGPCSSSSRFTH